MNIFSIFFRVNLVKLILSRRVYAAFISLLYSFMNLWCVTLGINVNPLKGIKNNNPLELQTFKFKETHLYTEILECVKIFL